MAYRLFLILLFLVALPRLQVAQGQEVFEQEKCSLCHIRQSVFFDRNFALPENRSRFDEERVCASCHNGAVEDSRNSLWQGAQHPAAVPGGKPSAQKPCSGCHSPHGKGGWGVLAGTRVSLGKGGDALCTGCHGGYDSRSGGIHRAGFPERGCSECHRAHGGVGNSLLREKSATLCQRCHASMVAKGGGHLVHGVSRNPSGGIPLPQCTSCHPVHRKEEPGNMAGMKCRTCHPSSARKEAGAMSPHPNEEECLSCHTFHEDSGKGGRGFQGKDIRPETLCGRCHPGYVASSIPIGREKATHVTRRGGGGRDLCFQCHRFHGGAPGTRRLVSGKPYSCLDCHERQNTINETSGIVLSHPVFEKVKEGRLTNTVRERNIFLGPAGEIVCATCHSVHRSSPLTPLLAKGFEQAESCFWCHEGKRGKDHLPAGDSRNGPQCDACHTVHGKPRGEDDDPWGMVCTTCHGKEQGHGSFSESRAIPRPSDLPGFDPKGRKVSIGGGISCPTCHDPHGRPARGKRLRKEYLSAGFLCSACHKDKETIALTPHDFRGIAGKSICEPCHLPHGGDASKMWGMKVDSADPGKTMCRSCHSEEGVASPVPVEGHPVNMIVPRPLPEAFPLFGPTGERTKKGLMTCSTCHEVHGTGIVPPAGIGTEKLMRFAGKRGIGDPGMRNSCLSCHAGKGNPHGNATCISCHPPHRKRKENESCQSCHPAKPGGMAKGHEIAGKGCAACHPMHDGDTKMPTGDRCVTCHPGAEKVRGTSHAGTGEGTCGACHPAHEDPPLSLEKRRAWEEVFPPDLRCLRCHNPKGTAPAPKWAEHPKKRTKVATTYGATVTMESPISMVGRIKEAGRPLFPLFDDNGAKSLAGKMGCLTCHDPHAGTTMKEEESRSSAVQYLRDPSGVFLADLCTPCHGGESGDHVRKFHELPRKTE